MAKRKKPYPHDSNFAKILDAAHDAAETEIWRKSIELAGSMPDACEQLGVDKVFGYRRAKALGIKLRSLVAQ